MNKVLDTYPIEIYGARIWPASCVVLAWFWKVRLPDSVMHRQRSNLTEQLSPRSHNMRCWNTWTTRLPCIPLCLVWLSAAQATYAQDTMSLPRGQVGAPYSAELKTEGGLAPLTWRIPSGELPPGLRLLATGKIEGTPTAARSEPYVLELSVSDSSTPPQTAVQRFSIVIVAPPLRIVGVAKHEAELNVVGISSAGPPEETTRSAPPNDPAPSPSDADPVVPRGVPQGFAVQNNNASSAPAPNPAQDQKQPDQTSQKNCSPPPTDQTGICGGPLLRTIVGFEQAGVSAAQSKQDFFFDLLYDRPLAFHMDPDLGPALRSWGTLRISSVPQQINTDVATFAANFTQQIGQLKVNQVAQSFEFLGGIEYRLFALPKKQPKATMLSADYASPPPYDPKIRQAVTINLILGGGVITPLSPKDSVQIFDVPSNQPTFFTLFPQAMGKQFVAFTLPDRNRFFRQAYGGLRLMAHPLGDTSRVRFPETFDLTYGFNESVTGGRIRGGVLRLEGFVPIPYEKTNSIYFFGTGIFKPGARATISSPFLLQAAPSGTLPTDPNAVVITTPQADRDYYRVGMGIDFIALVKNWKRSKPSGANQPSTGTQPTH